MTPSRVLVGTLGGYVSWRCVRRWYIFINSLLLIIGATVVLLSVYTKGHEFNDLIFIDRYESTKVELALWGSTGLIIIATLAIISSALISYHGILWSGVLLLSWLTGMITAVVATACVPDYTKLGSLHSALNTDMSNDPQFFYTLQSSLHCCGVDGYLDWKPSISNALPKSCCNSTSSCSKDATYTAGCFDMLKDMLVYYGWILVSIFTCASVADMIAVILSFLLCRKIGNANQRERTLRPTGVTIPRVPTLCQAPCASSSGKRKTVSWAR